MGNSRPRAAKDVEAARKAEEASKLATKKAEAAARKAELAAKRAEEALKKAEAARVGRTASGSSLYHDADQDPSNNGSDHDQGSGSETEREGEPERRGKKKGKAVDFPTEVPSDVSDSEERLIRIENTLAAIHGTLVSVSRQEGETAKSLSKLQSDNEGLREVMQNMLPGQPTAGASSVNTAAAMSIVDKMDERRAFEEMTGKSKIQRVLDKYGLPPVHKEVLSSAVKVQFASLLQIPSLRPADLKNFEAPSKEDAEAIVDLLDFGDPKAYTYCWDETRDFPFNEKARNAFYSHFKTSRKNTNWLTSYQFDDRLLRPETVLESLDSCIRTARRHWKTKDTPKEKDAEKEKANREFQRRYKASLIVKDKRHGFATRPDIATHANIVEKAPAVVHSDDSSSDESGVKNSVRNIPNKQLTVRRKYPIWRSLRFSLFLWGLDEVGTELEVAKVSATMHRKKGMPFRIRLPPRKFAEEKAPHGLPINCYSKQFLSTLQPWEKLCLAPLPAYDFPSEICKKGTTVWEKIPKQFKDNFAAQEGADTSEIFS